MSAVEVLREKEGPTVVGKRAQKNPLAKAQAGSASL
jgi:hypothetical protein